MSSKRHPLTGSTVVLPGEVYPESPVKVSVETFAAPGRTESRAVVEPADGATGVVIIARDGQGRLALVRQYREVLCREELELPRGFGSSSGALADAGRELMEEVGASTDALEELGFIHADSGLQRGRIAVIRATVSTPVAEPTDTDEIGSAVWMDQRDVRAAIADGTIRDGIGMAALMLEGSIRHIN